MRTVVCFGEIKQAALYFDHVLPVAFKKMTGTGTDLVIDFPEPVPSRPLINLIFDKNPQSDRERCEELGRIIDTWDAFNKQIVSYRQTAVESSVVDDYKDLHEAYLQNKIGKDGISIRAHFQKYASKLGIGRLSVLLPTEAECVDFIIEDPIATLSGLSLINAEGATWEQILEIRMDLESRKKLQRLRAFLTESYTGKSHAFLEDDLAQRIDEYESASRKHGFELISGTISTLLDASNLQGVAAASIASLVVGGPWAAISSAAIIEVGKGVIEFAKRRRAMTDWQRGHELAYLIELKRITQ